MTFILETPSGGRIQINVWNWRPTLLLVCVALDLDVERFKQLQDNFGGGEVTSAEAEQIADLLDEYLKVFPKDSRLLLDGSVTQEPKGSLDFGDGDWVRHYSASYDWLVSFRDFCRGSGGFKVF